MLIDSDVLVWLTRGHAGAAERLRQVNPWRISAVTSPGGRFQLSAENAYSVSAVTLESGAASTVRRTASAPAR